MNIVRNRIHVVLLQMSYKCSNEMKLMNGILIEKNSCKSYIP